MDEVLRDAISWGGTLAWSLAIVGSTFATVSAVGVAESELASIDNAVRILRQRAEQAKVLEAQLKEAQGTLEAQRAEIADLGKWGEELQEQTSQLNRKLEQALPGFEGEDLAMEIASMVAQVGAAHQILTAAQVPDDTSLERRMTALAQHHIASLTELDAAHAALDAVNGDWPVLNAQHALGERITTLLELLVELDNGNGSGGPPLTDNTLVVFFRENPGARKADAWRYFDHQTVGARVNKLAEEGTLTIAEDGGVYAK